MDIDASLRAFVAGIGLLPSALIAMALLGGPSAVWLLYRYVVQPRTSRYRASPTGPIWICAGCRSANELASSRCYRCHRELDETRIGLIDPGSGDLITITGSAIAPTPPALSPDRLADPRPDIAARRKPVAVGPGKPKAERKLGAVAAGGSAPKGSRPSSRTKG